MLRGMEALRELAVTIATDPYFPLTVLGVLVAAFFFAVVLGADVQSCRSPSGRTGDHGVGEQGANG